MVRTTSLSISLCALISVIAPSATPQCTLDEWGQFTSSPPAVGANFGRSLSVSGDRVIVGAPYENGSVGSAYIFERQGSAWVQMAVLAPSETLPVKNFGHRVAIDGSRAVVTAGSPEKAYVFDLDTSGWVQTADLVAADGTGGDDFGDAVSLSGARIAVGAPHKGAVYVFDKFGALWFQTAKISIGASLSAGRSVALEADRLIIGAPTYKHGTSVNAGRVYIYFKQGAVWTNVLTDPGSSSNAYHGQSVDLYGDVAASGAPGDREVSLYAWSGTTWSKTDTIKSGLGDFGRSLDLSANRLLVGAPNGGAAVSFEHLVAGWTKSVTFLPSDGIATDNFGSSVALVGDIGLVGSPEASVSGSQHEGKVYVVPALPPLVPYGDGCPGAGVHIPKLTYYGCPVPGGVMSLRIENGLGGAMALVFFGLDQSSIPLNKACSLLTFPLLPVNFLLILSGSGPGNGSITVTSAVPPTVPLGMFTSQAFVAEPTPAVFANSNGFLVRIQ